MPNPEYKTRRYVGLVILLLMVAVVAVVAWQHPAELKSLVQETLVKLRQAGPWVFFGAMAVLPAFGFPLMPFALAAGPVYGPVMGPAKVVLLAVAAVSANTAFSYGIARSGLTPVFRKLIRWFGYELPEIESRSAWAATLAFRLAPGLPFWAQSYALGILGVAWWPYIVVSTLVPSVYLTGAVYAGEAAWRGSIGAALFGVGLIVFAGVLTYLWRKRRASNRSLFSNSKASR